MEYIAGKTLAHLIYDHAPLPVQRVIPIIAQLGRALSAAPTWNTFAVFKILSR